MISSEFILDHSACARVLRERLAEPGPGRIQLVCGPRQVGKTTLLLALSAERGQDAIYVSADGPEAALSGFWERLWARAEAAATSRGRALVLLDEAHFLPDWAARLKGQWDRIRRKRLPIHVVATGSSALQLSTGSRESLAGRFERITLTHWTARALAAAFKLEEAAATDLLVTRGAYPGAMAYVADPSRWLAYVRDAIVEPAIGRDMLAHNAVRKPALLRQVFSVCATSPAQIVTLQKIQGQLQDRGALETIATYLALLEEAYLVAPLAKHAASRVARQRAAPPKLITLSNAMLAVADPRGAPDPALDAQRYGAWVENACLAHAINAGQQLHYWREEPHEVDAVLDGSWGPWAIEVKTGSVSAAELRGLSEFTRRHPKYRPIVLCDQSQVSAITRLGIAAQPWRKFLWGGLAPE